MEPLPDAELRRRWGWGIKRKWKTLSMCSENLGRTGSHMSFYIEQGCKSIALNAAWGLTTDM